MTPERAKEPGCRMSLAYLCRDCLHDFEGESETVLTRCPECASSRLLAHDELHDLSIAHIDCDAFYASVEKRDNPALRDRPVIIGGGHRGVVATCCYLARMKGVHSAMPMFTARRKCPDAVIIPPDMHKYSTVSRQIRQMMNSLSPLVEPLSIDEAFIDLNGTRELHKAFPAKTLARFARKVEQELGLTVSIGLSHNKFLAKIASDLDKPRGMALIGRKETRAFLAPRPISIIYGVGKVFAKKLRDDGFSTIGQLQNHDPDDLARRYGELGMRLAQLARGEDRRRLSVSRPAKSISSETTFNTDLRDFETLSTHLLALCEKVSLRMKQQRFVGHTVTLKLKTADFRSRTRARHLTLPTQLAHVIYETAAHLLQREMDGTAFRLIGVGMGGLEETTVDDPVDLLEPAIARKAAAERAMDRVREKFGPGALVRGKLYRQRRNENVSSPRTPDTNSPHGDTD